MKRCFATVMALLCLFAFSSYSMPMDKEKVISTTEMSKIYGGCALDCTVLKSCKSASGHTYYYKICVGVTYQSACMESLYNVCGYILSCIVPY